MPTVNGNVSDQATGAAVLPVSRSIPGAPPTITDSAPEDASGVSTLAATGRVKWFNDQKGFGFICDDEGRDVFVHYAVIEGEGFKTLRDGETVDYEFVDGPKGRRATRVARQGKGQPH